MHATNTSLHDDQTPILVKHPTLNRTIQGNRNQLIKLTSQSYRCMVVVFFCHCPETRCITITTRCCYSYTARTNKETSQYNPPQHCSAPTLLARVRPPRPSLPGPSLQLAPALATVAPRLEGGAQTRFPRSTTLGRRWRTSRRIPTVVPVFLALKLVAVLLAYCLTRGHSCLSKAFYFLATYKTPAMAPPQAWLL